MTEAGRARETSVLHLHAVSLSVWFGHKTQNECWFWPGLSYYRPRLR